MKDITFTDTGDTIIIHAQNPKGGQWIWKHLTTNVADAIHYERNRGFEVIGQMVVDGLEVGAKR